jgi:uncharacterized repeat protein (TIGR03803 family)
MQAWDGRFYGVTLDGGAFGYGSIFSVDRDLQTSYRILHEFHKSDGAFPQGPLLQADDGNIYGTTALGGSASSCPISEDLGCGTIFQLTLDGTFTTLYSFASSGADGSAAGVLIQDWQGSQGPLYGITARGGSADRGTVFQLTLDGRFTTMHSFTDPDGLMPDPRGLLQASDGNLYGRTQQTVFRLTRDGAFTVLHRFDTTPGCRVYTSGPLIEGQDGNFYGAELGLTGEYNAPPYGRIIRLTPSGDYTVLWAFSNLQPGGVAPSGVTWGLDGPPMARHTRSTNIQVSYSDLRCRGTEWRPTHSPSERRRIN